MKVKERLEGLARFAGRRPALAVTIVLALAIAGGLVALGLEPSAGPDTFVSRSSTSYVATAQDDRDFGADAVAILIREPLRDLVESKDLATVTFLEACLAGQYAVPSEQLQAFQPAPPGAHVPYGGWSSPCGKLMKAHPVRVVYGPGTFLNQAVASVNRAVTSLLKNARGAVSSAETAARRLALARGMSATQATAAAKAAGALEAERQLQQLARLYADSGIAGTPRIDDNQFIDQIVFGSTRGDGVPKSRFAYLFPTADSALIQVRLKASLTPAQQASAITWIRQAVRMPSFRLGHGASYTVTGVPVVLNDLAAAITGSIGGLLIAVLLVMAATLLIVFRSRLRLLPLVISLAAVAITFGILSLLGGTLTMASIAVLPILIGLAVDYAIQLQSRGAAAPTLAAAALASAVGFLALLLSPVPMVRGFGVLLVVGIAIALVCAVIVGSAAVVLSDRDGGVLGASIRGAAEILRERRPSLPRPRGGSSMRRVLGVLIAHPERVLAVGAALALVGWLADTQTAV
jgi:predicted RND superfamily exporter protein